MHKGSIKNSGKGKGDGIGWAGMMGEEHVALVTLLSNSYTNIGCYLTQGSRSYQYSILLFSGNAWEWRSHTFSPKTLFISVAYIDMLCGCDNEFLNFLS